MQNDQLPLFESARGIASSGASRAIRWLIGLALLSVLVWAVRATPAAGQAEPTGANATGTIAYVEDTNRDEIRLIEPDGSGDRRLWAHGLADPNNVYEIWGLAWSPNAGELAFTSTHENWCSIDYSDVFAIDAGGGNYRRITQSPSCAGLSAYPKGTVRVPVANNNIFGESFTGFVYFQGAPSILPVSLAPGGSTVLTFNNVADFGDGFLQIGAIVHPSGREISFATAIDVVPGQSITTGEMDLFVPTITWEARSPTWRSDGSRIGYFLNFASMFALPPNPSPLDLGQELQTDPSAMPDFTDLLRWGPPSKANQLLYRGNVIFDSQGVYLTTEGSASAGERLVSYETYQFIRGLAWLPDGSGFIFSVEELDGTFQAQRANLFEYNFASQQTRRITNFSDQFAGQLSVSSDGTQIVFDRAASNDPADSADLYIVNRDGSGLRLLKAGAREPSWSPGTVAVPRRLYLPSLLRP
jgi:hypothetical protein